ncbi:MAG: YraN family protein [Alphaproteobacteria bacterium]
MTNQKYKSWKQGIWAEKVALWFLRAQFYQILEHRYKTPMGEIDLIARRGKTLIFVEVKLRATTDEGLESISLHQQKRIKRAAEAYLVRAPKFDDLRFDVFLVKPYGFPLHIKSAF